MLQITPQERTTLLLLANGLSARELADRFGVTAGDMEARLTTLFARMGAASRDEAIAAACRRGLVDASQSAGNYPPTG
jgi:DNA-binding CsgD family transcriptional regulator